MTKFILPTAWSISFGNAGIFEYVAISMIVGSCLQLALKHVYLFGGESILGLKSIFPNHLSLIGSQPTTYSTHDNTLMQYISSCQSMAAVEHIQIKCTLFSLSDCAYDKLNPFILHETRKEQRKCS